jgi:hypothetical protein
VLPPVQAGVELGRDIHAQEAIDFMHRTVQASPWVREILTAGYNPSFYTEPSEYSEDNNKSAKDHMDFLREKVGGWLDQGFVEQLIAPAFCNNPMSVAEQFDLTTTAMKKRPVLAMSRRCHVNKFVVDRTV